MLNNGDLSKEEIEFAFYRLACASWKCVSVNTWLKYSTQIKDVGLFVAVPSKQKKLMIHWQPCTLTVLRYKRGQRVENNQVLYILYSYRFLHLLNRRQLSRTYWVAFQTLSHTYIQPRQLIITCWEFCFFILASSTQLHIVQVSKLLKTIRTFQSFSQWNVLRLCCFPTSILTGTKDSSVAA